MEVEKSIIARCKKMDKSGFMELFKLYEKYLFKLCFSYVQNEQDALDLTQEVYIKVFNHFSKYDDKMAFHPWIRAVAVNTCLNFKRTVKYNTVSLNGTTGEEDEVAPEDRLASCSDVEAEVESAELGEIIKKNLDKLSPKHRMVLTLRYYEGLSYEEISAVMKEPLGTVKTDIFRARNILKEKLRIALQG